MVLLHWTYSQGLIGEIYNVSTLGLTYCDVSLNFIQTIESHKNAKNILKIISTKTSNLQKSFQIRRANAYVLDFAWPLPEALGLELSVEMS